MTDDHTPQSPEDRRIAEAFDRLNEDTRETVMPSRSLAKLHQQSRPWVRAVAPALGTAVLVVVVIGLFGLFRAVAPEQEVVDSPPTTTAEGPTTTVPTTETPTTTTPPPTTATTTDVLPPAAPETYRVVGVNANDVLNVRADPDLASSIISFFPPDATGIQTTGVAQGDWLEVFTTEGGLGWANRDFLALETGPGYRVVGVAADDTLAVRSGPGTSNPKVGDLAHDATDVHLTGRATGGTEPWWEVLLPDGTRGWSASRFLRPPLEWDADFETVPCDGFRSLYTLEDRHSGPPSEADAVLAVAFSRDTTGTCTRTVITLGVAAGFTADGWWGEPASTEPGEVSIRVQGQVVMVELPGITEVRPVAVTTSNSDGDAYVVRTPDGNLAVAIHADEGVLVRSVVLGDPARVVVDTIPFDGTAGHGFYAGDLVLASPVRPDDGSPVQLTDTTIRVAGYARPFESSGIAQLREAAAEPGGGQLVVAQWDMDAGPVTDSTAPFSTTDWVTTWGLFEFTVSDLRAGSYELFVGEFSAKDGEPVGLYVPIEVVP